ncbi:MAG: glycosyltransferase family 4 protein [Candidatus Latescibacterota bacterium]
MARIRVLQVVTRLAVRGVPRHVLDVAAGLDPERFEVEVLAGASEPGEGELWEEARQRGVSTHYLPWLCRPVNPWRDALALEGVYRWIRHGRYDIVHTHISKAGILGRLAARWAGVPGVLHTYHGQVEEVRGGGLASRLFLACERRAARWCDLLIAVSTGTAQQCLACGIGRPEQYRVIHNGIEVSRFAQVQRGPSPLGGSGPGPHIGTIGSLTPEKGIEVLLRALPGLVPDWPHVQLHVVGDGRLRAALESLAERLGVRGRVHFPGIVADVRPYLAHFDVLAMPSLQEGLPTVVLEAMAAGCPLVASSVGGIPEIVEQDRHGILVPAGDAPSLEEALRTLLEDPARRVRLGRAAQERVQATFDLGSMLERLATEYERLLLARVRS